MLRRPGHREVAAQAVTDEHDRHPASPPSTAGRPPRARRSQVNASPVARRAPGRSGTTRSTSGPSSAVYRDHCAPLSCEPWTRTTRTGTATVDILPQGSAGPVVGWSDERPGHRRRARHPPRPRGGAGARRAVQPARHPGTELYAAAHLPGAPHLDLDAALAGPPGVRGRHPLPDPDVLQAALRACGRRRRRRGRRLRPGDLARLGPRLVGAALGRSPAVRVLDGGLAAWRVPGTRSPPRCPHPAPGSITVRPGSVPVLDAGRRGRDGAQGVLLDVRTAERYRGETEPIDRVAGHVPGAVNLPMTDLLAADGTLPARRRGPPRGPPPRGCTATPRSARRAARASPRRSSSWRCTPPASTPSRTSGRGASGSRTRRDRWPPARPARDAHRAGRRRAGSQRVGAGELLPCRRPRGPGRRRRPGRACPR